MPAPKRRPAAPVLPQGLTVEQVVPDALWSAIEPHMPTPRQLNKADQRVSLRRIAAGMYLQHVIGVPGKHLPAVVADRKTIRDRMRRWETDGRWESLRPVLERHAAAHPLDLST